MLKKMQKKIFRDARNTLQDQERLSQELQSAERQYAIKLAEKAEIEANSQLCSTFYNTKTALSRLLKRQRILQSLQFICPYCRRYVLSSKAWVIRGKETPRCRQCDKNYRLICINGDSIRKMREKSGLTQKEFAQYCGYSRLTQIRLEQREQNYVAAERLRIWRELEKRLHPEGEYHG